MIWVGGGGGGKWVSGPQIICSLGGFRVVHAMVKIEGGIVSPTRGLHLDG